MLIINKLQILQNQFAALPPNVLSVLLRQRFNPRSGGVS